MANPHIIHPLDLSTEHPHPPTDRARHVSTSVLLATTVSTLLLALAVVVLAAGRSPLVTEMAEAVLFTA